MLSFTLKEETKFWFHAKRRSGKTSEWTNAGVPNVGVGQTQEWTNAGLPNVGVGQTQEWDKRRIGQTQDFWDKRRSGQTEESQTFFSILNFCLQTQPSLPSSHYFS